MRCIVLAAFVLGVAVAGAAQSDTLASTRDGVYTEAQARRGKGVFDGVCAECHAPVYFSQTFPSWVGAPVSMLFDAIRTSMPEDRPGALTPQQYADVLAYIFELNGLPPGPRELPPESGRLQRILIQRSP